MFVELFGLFFAGFLMGWWWGNLRTWAKVDRLRKRQHRGAL